MRTTRLSRLSHRITDGTHATFDRVADGVPLLSAKNVREGFIEVSDDESLISVSDAAAIRRVDCFQPGDVLMTIVGSIGRVAVLQQQHEGLVFQRSVASVRPRDSNAVAEYLAWALQAKPALEHFALFARQSAQAGLYLDDLAATPIPDVPLTRQRQIADFLNEQCSRIDDLVALREQQIVDMVERHRLQVAAAVISGGARGLSDGSPLALLASPPAAWTVAPARYLVRVTTGDGDTQDGTDEGYPFFVRSQTVNAISRYTHDCEAVMTSGDGAGVGKIFHHYTGKFAAHQRVYVMTDFQRVSGRWFYYAFSTLFPLVALDGSAKNTVDSVRRHMITSLPIPVPPPVEQARLCRDLDMAVQRVSEISVEMADQVELLRQRKRSLITAAVTGEFDVTTAGGRGVVA